MCRTEFVLQNKGVQKTGTMASVNNKAACYCVVANYCVYGNKSPCVDIELHKKKHEKILLK